MLLSEVHHRVKNNLAVISGFLQLEELKSEKKHVQEILFKNYMRVKSMGMIHEELYQHNDFVNVNFDQFLQKLKEVWDADKRVASRHISITTDLDPVTLTMNQAVPFALIVNELISNSVEYAFAGKDNGNISIKLDVKELDIILQVKDDGVGLPDNFDLSKSPTLGNTLVYSYSEQLNSKIEVDSDDGAIFTLKFKKNDSLTGSSAHVMV